MDLAKIRLYRIIGTGGIGMAYIRRDIEGKITALSQEYACILLTGPRQVKSEAKRS